MMFGVIFFSMISGSLASILATLDHSNAELENKVMFLARLKEKYDLPNPICEEITRSLSYDTQMATNGINDFV